MYQTTCDTSKDRVILQFFKENILDASWVLLWKYPHSAQIQMVELGVKVCLTKHTLKQVTDSRVLFLI